MARVVNPGGTIVVVDPDYGTQVVDVPDQELARRVLRFQADGVRNGTPAHQMWRLFAREGLADVHVEAAPIVSATRRRSTAPSACAGASPRSRDCSTRTRCRRGRTRSTPSWQTAASAARSRSSSPPTEGGLPRVLHGDRDLHERPRSGLPTRGGARAHAPAGRHVHRQLGRGRRRPRSLLSADGDRPRGAVRHWIAAWSDLATFEVHPVIDSAQAAARVDVRWGAGR
jgi:hypothetical protein